MVHGSSLLGGSGWRCLTRPFDCNVKGALGGERCCVGASQEWPRQPEPLFSGPSQRHKQNVMDSLSDCVLCFWNVRKRRKCIRQAIWNYLDPVVSVPNHLDYKRVELLVPSGKPLSWQRGNHLEVQSKQMYSSQLCQVVRHPYKETLQKSSLMLPDDWKGEKNAEMLRNAWELTAYKSARGPNSTDTYYVMKALLDN